MMKLLRNGVWICAAMLTLVPGGAVFGQHAVSINLYQDGIYSLGGTDSAGVVSVSGWNNVQTDNSATVLTPVPVNDAGGFPAASFQITEQRGWQDQVSTNTPDASMMSGYVDSGLSATSQLKISGLGSEYTANGYNLIVYLKGTDSMGADTFAEFGAKAETSAKTDEAWLRYQRSPFTGFRASSFDTEDAAQGSGGNGNYVVFSNLMAADVDLTLLKDPDSINLWSRCASAGLQIAANEPVTAVGFNFIGREDRGGVGLDAGDLAGAMGFAQRNWNNLSTDYHEEEGAVPVMVVDADGIPVGQDNDVQLGLRVQYDSNTTWANALTVESSDDKLMKGYLDDAAVDGKQPYVQVENIPYDSYSVVVYIDGDQGVNGIDGSYWIEEATANPHDDGADLSAIVYVKESGHFGGAYQQVTLASTDKANPEYGNFIVFTGLHQADIKIRGMKETGSRAPINGFQIVQSIPEPEVLKLVGADLVGPAANRRFELSWTSQTGNLYRVQSSLDMTDDNWILVEENIPANPPVDTLQHDLPLNPSLYYRVEAYPAP